MKFMIPIFLLNSVSCLNDIEIKRVMCNLENLSSLCRKDIFLFINKYNLKFEQQNSNIINTGVYFEHKNQSIISIISARFSSDQFEPKIRKATCIAENLCILFKETYPMKKFSIYKIVATNEKIKFVLHLKINRVNLVLYDPITDDSGVYIRMFNKEIASIVILKVLDIVSSVPVDESFNQSSIGWAKWNPCVCLNNSKLPSYRTRYGNSMLTKQKFIMYGNCKCSGNESLYDFVVSDKTQLNKSLVKYFKQPEGYKNLVDIELKDMNSSVNETVFLECQVRDEDIKNADIKWEIWNKNYSFYGIRGDFDGKVLVNKRNDLIISDLHSADSDFLRCYQNGKLKKIIKIRFTNSLLEIVHKYVRLFGCLSTTIILILSNILVFVKYKHQYHLKL